MLRASFYHFCFLLRSSKFNRGNSIEQWFLRVPNWRLVVGGIGKKGFHVLSFVFKIVIAYVLIMTYYCVKLTIASDTQLDCSKSLKVL